VDPLVHDAVDPDGIHWNHSCVMQWIPRNPVDSLVRDAVDPNGIQWIPLCVM